MHWETSVAPALNVTEGGFPFNTRATPVMRPIPGLPDVDFVMAVDYGRLAVHNASAGAGDRNLSHGWRLLPWNAAENGGFSACPSIHWAEEDGACRGVSDGHGLGEQFLGARIRIEWLAFLDPDGSDQSA